MTFKVSEVFTPNDQPDITYVVRSGRSLENDLKDHFDTKNVVVSISGPSKTGKTVLLRNVLDMDFVISLSGSAIKNTQDFFEQIFNWIEVPIEESKTTGATTGLGGGASASGEAKLPLFAKGKAAGHVSGSKTLSSSETSNIPKNPFQRIIKEIANSEFSVFVDDFHYIPSDQQIELAKIIKGLAENGVRILTASVPHRAEDVVRANPELRGRMAGIDISEWEIEDLRKIAIQGFKALYIRLDDATIETLASHSHGSPQLMQTLCLNLCRSLSVREKKVEEMFFEVSKEILDEALETTSSFANSAKLTQILHGGPKVKGQPRMEYDFVDGSRGDVYRCILLAITQDPIQKEFTYDEIYARVKAVCKNESPTGQSISQSLTYLNNIVESNFEKNSYFEWDDERLYIIDPYLAFYLRCSRKLEDLGNRKR